MNPQFRAFLAALAVSAVTLTACGQSTTDTDTDTDTDPIRIAVNLRETPLDGVHRNAIELRTEQLNDLREETGLPPIELVYADTADAAAGLTTDPTIAAMISGSCGDCLLSLLPDITTAELPSVVLAADAAVVNPVTERRWVFQIAPSPTTSADRIAQRIADTTDTPTVAVIATDDTIGTEGAAEMAAALNIYRLDVAHTEVFAAGDAAAAAAAGAAVGTWTPPPPADPFTPTPAGPVDTVVVWTPYLDTTAVVESLHDNGFDGDVLLSPHSVGEPFLGGPAGNAMRGAVALSTLALVSDQLVAANPVSSNRAQWSASYTTRFHANHPAASYAADAVTLIHLVTTTAGSDRERIRTLIETSNITGFTGLLRFSPNNHNGLDTTSLVFLRFSGDRWQNYE